MSINPFAHLRLCVILILSQSREDAKYTITSIRSEGRVIFSISKKTSIFYHFVKIRVIRGLFDFFRSVLLFPCKNYRQITHVGSILKEIGFFVPFELLYGFIQFFFQ